MMLSRQNWVRVKLNIRLFNFSATPLLEIRWKSLSIIYTLLQLVRAQDISKLDGLFDRACCDPEQLRRLYTVIRETFTGTAL